MSQKMMAVVVRGGSEFVYEAVERPVAGPGEVILRIEAAGICAADRKIYSQNHPWQLPDPYFPGHEYVGRVVELGQGAAEQTGLAPGERAIAEILVPCRRCWFCQRGLYTHCDQPGVCVGSWAEYMRIPAGAIVHKVPDELLPEEGALIEPLACAVHAVNLARIELADSVVVSGLGAIGMGILQVARLKTPSLLAGLDVDDGLLKIAAQLGADIVLNPTRDDVTGELRALTGGRGPDIYIEASGSVASLRTGLEMLRKAGRLVVFGVYGQEATLDFNLISEFKELEIRGGHVSPNTYPLAIDFLAEGLVDWKAMVTHTFPLARYEQALRIKEQPGVTSIKTLLIP
ncbi:MAG: alcohol dehydrogenase catalytic domain-containing protein [Anaerolineae bacterium]